MHRAGELAADALQRRGREEGDVMHGPPGVCRGHSDWFSAESATYGCAHPAVPANLSKARRQFLATFHGLLHRGSRSRGLSLWRDPLMVIKLHRILALALLCAGLLVAGAPAIACCAEGTPTHDCCPSRSHSVGDLSYENAPHSDLQSCCAAGAQTAAVSALDVTPGKTNIQSAQADPLLSIIFLVALSANYSSARSGVASATPFYFPAPSPLYLRTRRLRL